LLKCICAQSPPFDAGNRYANKTMHENIKLEFLRNIQLFSSLTDEELNEISSKITLEEFKKNEIVLYEEDTNQFMYIILFGKVKVVQTTEDGKEIILAIHKSNDFFGEISLIDGKTSPATVLTTENSLIAIISKKDFFLLLSNQEKVLDRLLQILCLRLRESWKRIYILNFKNASERVKMLFLMLSYDNGKKTPEGVILNIKLTHQNIADMTGLSRETVTRVLDKWQKTEDITILKNKFIRLNPKFLQKDLKV
jgi:CRP/FNR family cyclic AMP-dependent transcriptional regulator